MESAGCYALCDAAGPAGVGQIQASASGDARSEVAGSVPGGNIEVMWIENKHWKGVGQL